MSTKFFLPRYKSNLHLQLPQVDDKVAHWKGKLPLFSQDSLRALLERGDDEVLHWTKEANSDFWWIERCIGLGCMEDVGERTEELDDSNVDDWPLDGYFPPHFGIARDAVVLVGQLASHDLESNCDSLRSRGVYEQQIQGGSEEASSSKSLQENSEATSVLVSSFSLEDGGQLM